MTKKLNKGFSLDKTKITYVIDKVIKDKNEINLVLEVNAKALKKVDRNEIVKQVVFKDKKEIEQLVKDKFTAEGLKLSIEQKIPLFDQRTPLFKKNISLEISSL